jgi:hypothetical protein
MVSNAEFFSNFNSFPEKESFASQLRPKQKAGHKEKAQEETISQDL